MTTEAETCMASNPEGAWVENPAPVHVRQPIDPAKIKVGDEVTVRVKVSGVLFGGGLITDDLDCDRDGMFVHINNKTIVTHTPKAKPLRALDRVSTASGPGTIIAINGPRAWVALDEGGDDVFSVVDCARIDP